MKKMAFLLPLLMSTSFTWGMELTATDGLLEKTADDSLAEVTEELSESSLNEKAKAVLTATNDPTGNALYGGQQADEFFQKQGLNVAYFLACKIDERYSFETLYKDAANLRKDIAEKTHTMNAQDFSILRTPESVPWAAGATTPILQYKDMTRVAIENLSQLPPTEEWLSLDDALEYRFRTRTVAEWLALAETEHTENNQLKTFLYRIFTGQRDHENQDGCMWVFDKEKDWVDSDGNKVFKPNKSTMYRYSRWLKMAHESALSKDDPYDISEKVKITLSYVETRFKDTDVQSRGFMFPNDADSKPDLSDRPFALCHPPTNSLEYHLSKCCEAFESARRSTGDTHKKVIKILESMYKWSITMPFARGSAADSELLATGLFIYHNLGLPKRDILKKADEYAQSSLTSKQFVDRMLDLGIEELDPLPFTMEEFLKTLMPATMDEQATKLREIEESQKAAELAKSKLTQKEYPDAIFGVSAKGGNYPLDILINQILSKTKYNEIVKYITENIKNIAMRWHLQNPAIIANPQALVPLLAQYDTLQVSLTDFAKCEEAFNAALTYQSDDATTYENIKRYYNLYNETKPYAEGTEIVNNLLFQALCLYQNIVPQLMDGTSLITPQQSDAPLAQPLFKGRHVVASRAETETRLSAFLDALDPAARDTELCEIMKKCGSDKSTDIHNYTQIYSFLFGSKRETAQNVFEMGIGSTDPSFGYTMGPNGTPGASFKGWREYFPNAQIFGADIDKQAIDTFNALGEDRIKTYTADQLDPATVNAMFDQTGVSEFDIMVDDGFHCFEANHKLFLEGIKRLAPGGIYVIEDIAPRGVPLVLKLLEEISGEYDVAFIQLPTVPGRFDNNIFVLFKNAAEV